MTIRTLQAWRYWPHTAAIVTVLSSGSPATRGIDEPAGGTLISADVRPDAALSRCLGGSPERPAAHSEFEPHAAVNPRDSRNVVVAWNTVGANGHKVIRAAASFDGGSSWTAPQVLPFTACADGPSKLLTRVGDAWVSFGPDGRVYVSAISSTEPVGSPARTLRPVEQSSIVATTSSDGGRTWKAALVGTQKGPRANFDNTAVIAHPSRPGTAFLLTTRIEEPSTEAEPNLNGHHDEQAMRPAALSKTTDGGQKWSGFAVISPNRPGDYADAPQMVVDSRTGVLYVFYSTGLEGGVVQLVKSADDGQTWSTPVRVASHVRPRTMATVVGLSHSLAFAEDIVHPAIDSRTGRLYLILADGRFTNGGAPHVAITSSVDGGKTWTQPRRADDSSVFGSVLPSINVTDDRRVAITYFDTQKAPRGGGAPVTFSLRERVFRLNDAGEIGELRERLIDRFEFVPVPGAQRSYFMGDYFALVSVDNALHAVYTRTVRRKGPPKDTIGVDVLFGR